MVFLLKQLLLPPVSLILLALLGLALPRQGRWIAGASLVLLLLLATPLGVSLLTSSQTQPTVLTLPSRPDDGAQAIVIIGCDSDHHAEMDGEDVGPLTLARLRYGGRLQRRTGLPILLSGGRLDDDTASLAELMQRSLANDFQLTARWLETRSQDTWENAALSAELLREQGITQVYLVTQARDMARARWSFERTGLKVIPAPTGFEDHRPDGWRDLVPSAKSLLASYYTIYEIIGGLFYQAIH